MQRRAQRWRVRIGVAALAAGLYLIVMVLIPLGQGLRVLAVVGGVSAALFWILGRTIVRPPPWRRCPRCRQYGLERMIPGERFGVHCALCGYENEDEVWERFSGHPEDGLPVEYPDGRRPCRFCPACGEQSLERMSPDEYFGVQCFRCGFRDPGAILEDHRASKGDDQCST